MSEIAAPINRFLNPGALRTMAALGMGTMLTADHVTTYTEYRHQAAEAHAIVHDHNADMTIYTLPGCRTDVSTIEPMLEPTFGEHANTAYISYPYRGFSLQAIGKALLEAKAALGGRREAAVYGLSMGGPVFGRLLEDAEFRQAFGPIDRLVLDSSPSSIQDVRRGPRMWLEAATAAQFSKTLNSLSRHVMVRQAERCSTAHGSGVTDEQVKNHHLATARTPLYTIAHQGHLIRHGSTQGLAHALGDAHAYYLESPGNSDKVVKTEQAYRRYNLALDGRLKRVIDYERPLGSHAAGPEYPQLPAQLLGVTQ